MARIPLYYTFGNHMHWVDMQWLWGYHVLPGSVRDMIRFCDEAGVKGNVNFDGVGYEKMAAEAPDELAILKNAVLEGKIEPVGCSYGQPYGLFHGGESNVRHRIYGVRAVMKLLGKRPTTFWEEEFDFFPQLPQMLKGVGFKYSSLFFQWTWHTPEIPKEEEPVVWWEGMDGSRLLCATRNRLNLHQWPEDMDILFDDLANEVPKAKPPLILQWLELMPSPDWMCRSELLLPKMKELLSDDRFEIKAATLPEYLEGFEGAELPVRSYKMDDVWHGMSLGKNNDYMRRRSSLMETTLQQVECLSAVSGLFGRPYQQWDVYPTWELEEAWRVLLQSQHHDNDECEGLCAHVAKAALQGIDELLEGGQKGSKVMERIDAPSGSTIVFNPLGWPRSLATGSFMNALSVEAVEIPAFGFAICSELEGKTTQWKIDGSKASIESGAFRAVVDLSSGTLEHISNGERQVWPKAGRLSISYGGQVHQSEVLGYEVLDGELALKIKLADEDGRILFRLAPYVDALDMDIEFFTLSRPDPGMNAGMKLHWDLPAGPIDTDQPYGFSQVERGSSGMKKYPKGDWMTSPQWFEEVYGAFTSQSVVDLGDLLILHDGTQQWFRTNGGVDALITMYDPWDEDYFDDAACSSFRLMINDGMPRSWKWRLAREFQHSFGPSHDKEISGGDIPLSFFTLACHTNNVNVTAFYRETEDQGAKLETYAGRGMGYPYILRLVEFDGLETDVDLDLAGTVAKAYKTNLLGQIEHEIQPEVGDKMSKLRFKMRPHEIGTLYIDIVEGRKQTRDLDAHRNIWATVHRVED